MVDKYSFKTEDPDIFSNSWVRIARENFLEDKRDAIILVSNYLNEAHVVIRQGFLDRFIVEDRVFVAGEALCRSWGEEGDLLIGEFSFRLLPIQKSQIKKTISEIEAALNFKRKVKVGVYTFGRNKVGELGV